MRCLHISVMPLSFFLLIKNNLGLGTISLVAFLHGCCSAILRGSTPCMCTLLLSPCDLLISRFCSPVWLVFGTLTETYFEKAVNNGSLSKHKVSWQSILKGPWKYWAKTLQCLFIVQLMSSVAQQQSFTASLTFNWSVIVIQSYFWMISCDAIKIQFS